MRAASINSGVTAEGAGAAALDGSVNTAPAMEPAVTDSISRLDQFLPGINSLPRTVLDVVEPMLTDLARRAIITLGQRASLPRHCERQRSDQAA